MYYGGEKIHQKHVPYIQRCADKTVYAMASGTSLRDK